jgi:exoribonuclease R
MAAPQVRTGRDTDELIAGFARIRDEFEVPAEFPPEVLAEADGEPRGVEGDRHRRDRRDLPLVTIDPPGSRDLDQAFTAEARGDGFRVYYAIADVAAFVAPGGALDAETWRRGVTLYSPDLRTPLHPDSLGEGAASLLPDQDRPALLWEFDLDAEGGVTASRIEPAVVRSRAALSYARVDAELRSGGAVEPLRLLETIGRLRLEREVARGGVSLDLPHQKVERVGDGGQFELVYEANLPVEEWNAEISLLTGMQAARIMLDGGIGVLRTLPPPDEWTLNAIRRSARKLGQPWPPKMSYPDFVRSIDRADQASGALLHQAARALSGAGYLAFDKATTPSKRARVHSAVAAAYAHVTAPLRRLVDRYANEVVLATAAGRPIPEWAASRLAELPKTMRSTRGRETQLAHAMLDFTEAVVLRPHVGEVFDAAVTNIDKRGAAIQLVEPAVLARMPAGGVRLGEDIETRLTAAVPDERRVSFELA